ncbi:MAG: uroporphyrinogen-III synthase [Erythrobacter sp.]
MANNAKHPQINLLLTRPKTGAEEFWSALEPSIQNLATPIFSPLLKIISLRPELIDLGSVIFSSVNGVAHSPKGDNKIAYCVGAMTTKAAKKSGWKAVQLGDTADELVKTMQSMDFSTPLTHLCGVHTRGQIAQRLTSAKRPTARIAVYDQKQILLNALAIEAQHSNFPLLVPLFSPRTARNFAKQHKGTAPLYLIALSQDVAAEVKGLSPLYLAVSNSPTRMAMIDVVQNVAREVALG